MLLAFVSPHLYGRTTLHTQHTVCVSDTVCLAGLLDDKLYRSRLTVGLYLWWFVRFTHGYQLFSKGPLQVNVFMLLVVVQNLKENYN